MTMHSYCLPLGNNRLTEKKIPDIQVENYNKNTSSVINEQIDKTGSQLR